MRDQIEVKLSDRSYPILIEAGLRNKFGEEARKLLSPRCRQAAIISNRRVFDLHGQVICKGLETAGLAVSTFLIGDGERYKTLRTAEKIYTHLIEHRLERGDS